MKQQGHSSNMTCLSYSPDSEFIVTGGLDGKLKLWNTANGFCIVTFSEHTSAITQVQFCKKFFVSSSLDGTVRAFDITRYNNKLIIKFAFQRTIPKYIKLNTGIAISEHLPLLHALCSFLVWQ